MNKITKCFKLIFLDNRLSTKTIGMLHYLNTLPFVSTLDLLLNAFVIESYILDSAFGLPIKSLALTTASANIPLKAVKNLCHHWNKNGCQYWNRKFTGSSQLMIPKNTHSTLFDRFCLLVSFLVHLKIKIKISTKKIVEFINHCNSLHVTLLDNHLFLPKS